MILQGGFNEEHKVSINTAKQITKALSKLKLDYKTLTVNPDTFEKDILKISNKYICFNALHGTFGEDGKIQRILKNNKFYFLEVNTNPGLTTKSILPQQAEAAGIDLKELFESVLN